MVSASYRSARALQVPIVKVWVPRTEIQNAMTSCDDKFPNESGGLLFGYRASTNDFVVEHISNPGPKAEHGSRRYVPDYGFDEAYALNLHKRSGGKTTYLGDWHSHPSEFSSSLSWKDRKASKRIILSEEAGISTALSMLLFGTKGRWNTRVWACELETSFVFLHSLVTIRAEIKLYNLA